MNPSLECEAAMRFPWLWALIPVVLASPLHADDAVVYRYLELRDGSVLRLPVRDEEWKITTIKPDGAIVESRIRLSKLRSFLLTPEKGFARKQALLTAVRRLGSDDFREREKAQAELAKFGPTIRPDLETCLQYTTDVETRTRLRALLAAWPNPEGVASKSSAIFDVFEMPEPCWGHLGDDGIAVLIGGQERRLTRQDVHRLSVAPLLGIMRPSMGAASANTFRRLASADFPAGCSNENFEKGPDGLPLKIGENVEKRFLKKGFVLSTSIATSYVSVNNFAVQGKSGGLSLATHQPLWEGEITIRFVQPGREDVPAGVTHFGCWIAAVMPRGTALLAYDLHGHELGKIETQTSGHDFLGVQSAIPIHRLKIVPNVQIDRDYTLDDFTFTPPIPFEATHADKFTVQLLEGDRLFCTDVSFGKEGIKLQGLPAGLPDWTIPPGRFLRVNGPEKNKPGSLPPGVFAELRDGSVLFGLLPGGKNGQPLFPRRPRLWQERALLAGLWGGDQPRQVQPPKGDGIAYLWRSTKEWVNYSRLEFQEEAVVLSDMVSKLVVDYKDLSSLWLAAPKPQPLPGSWHVRTRQGDDLIVGPPEQFGGAMAREITVPWQGQTLRLPAAEVTAIYQVPKE